VETGYKHISEMATKILFADDDGLMHRLYHPHLERAGFKVVGASNGREALEAAARERPQVAVVDVMMPEVDGLSVVLELKKTQATRMIPVILISGDAKCYQCKKEFMGAGAAAFLTKPFSGSQLLEVVRRLVTGSPV
jgi:CheY-like chemotaxis protein